MGRWSSISQFILQKKNKKDRPSGVFNTPQPAETRANLGMLKINNDTAWEVTLWARKKKRNILEGKDEEKEWQSSFIKLFFRLMAPVMQDVFEKSLLA